MKEPTEEQIKELWEWCGVKPRYQDIRDENITYPRIDLNNLFEYAVPKLKVVRLDWNDIIQDWVYHKVVGNLQKDALALFWAIHNSQ